MKPRRKQREKRAHAGLWAIIIVLAGIGLVGYGCYQGVMSLIDDWCADLPSVQNTTAFDLPEQSTIYANDGTTVLAELYMEKREPVTIDQVSPYVLKGTVATEDERFYDHGGVDLQGHCPRGGRESLRRSRGCFHHHAAVCAQHHLIFRDERDFHQA